MEKQRNQYLALRGICLRAALVLVSAVPDLDSEWHNDSVLAARVDAVAGSHRRSQRLFRNRGGMAAFRNVRAGGFSCGVGGKTAFLGYILRPRHRKFSPNRANRGSSRPNPLLRAAVS